MDSHAPGFGNVTRELSTELDVEGTIPDWLTGSLIRNGPGKFEADGHQLGHVFDGLAMLRKFAFRDGRIVYRNRFLRTDAYDDAHRGAYTGGFGTDDSMSLLGRALAILGPPTPTDNTNVNVWRYGGEYVALTETENLALFDPATLATTGLTTYLGEPRGQHVGGHPHHDRDREETIGMSTFFGRQPEYRVWRQPDGRWARETIARVPIDEPAYLHSFALTDRYVVLGEYPLVVSPFELLYPSNEAFIKRFRWEPDRGTRFVVLDRETGERVATPVADPFFCFHQVNAYDADDGDVVVDLVAFPDADSIDAVYFDGPGNVGDVDVEGSRIDRYRIDPVAGRVEGRTLDEDHFGMPRVAGSVRHDRHRYVYGHASGDDRLTGLPGRLAKVDVEEGTRRYLDAEGAFFTEPVFVPRPGNDAEDDGVVLTVRTPDGRPDGSVLHVVDAESFEELARARLPHVPPLDFHGQWFPDVGDPTL